MNNLELEKLKDRAVVIAITHDEARIWLLNDESSQPIHVIVREEQEHIHVRQAQAHHGHASEIGEPNFFDDIADVLTHTSDIVLLGHGTGKANAAERFERHIGDHHKSILERIAVEWNVNIPALTEGELIAEARRRWKASADLI